MNLLTLKEVDKEWMLEVIDKAIEIKKNPSKYYDLLKNKTLAMLFQKTSTRTRVSFEAGMTQLGGHAIFLDFTTTQLHKASLKDEIRCIARYADIIMARVYGQKIIEEIASYSRVPVINGLSDQHHPCQIMADLMTIYEREGKFKSVRLGYIGDGNNICNSLIIGCKKVGLNLQIACPKGYEPSEKFPVVHAPKKIIQNVDYLYTDTWISMGQEKEKEKRIKAFRGFQLNKKLLGTSKAKIMHCLPAYDFEITREIVESKNSIIFDQAENRLHVQKAILLKLLNKI